MPVERDNPELILIREQEQAARPRTSLSSRTWPTSGEFVAPPRPRAPPLPVRTPPRLEPPLRFITSSAAARAHSAASGTPAPTAMMPPTPPEPQTPHSTPPHAGKRHPNTLTGRALKVVVVLNAPEVLDLGVRDGQSRVVLTIRLPDRTLTADISAKSARRAIAAVREHGTDAVACIIQGRLEGSAILDAGLSAQPKGPPKPAAEPAA